jgi:hypothetical protein
MREFARLQKVTASFVTSSLLPLTKNSVLTGRIFIIFFVGHLLIGRDNVLIFKSEKSMDNLHEDINIFMNTLVLSVVMYKIVMDNNRE